MMGLVDWTLDREFVPRRAWDKEPAEWPIAVMCDCQKGRCLLHEEENRSRGTLRELVATPAIVNYRAPVSHGRPCAQWKEEFLAHGSSATAFLGRALEGEGVYAVGCAMVLKYIHNLTGEKDDAVLLADFGEEVERTNELSPIHGLARICCWFVGAPTDTTDVFGQLDEVLRTSKSLCLVMPYYGPTLAEVCIWKRNLRPDGPIWSAAELNAIILGLLYVARELQKQGFVHRDVHAKNVAWQGLTSVTPVVVFDLEMMMGIKTPKVDAEGFRAGGSSNAMPPEVQEANVKYRGRKRALKNVAWELYDVFSIGTLMYSLMEGENRLYGSELFKLVEDLRNPNPRLRCTADEGLARAKVLEVDWSIGWRGKLLSPKLFGRPQWLFSLARGSTETFKEGDVSMVIRDETRAVSGFCLGDRNVVVAVPVVNGKELKFILWSEQQNYVVTMEIDGTVVDKNRLAMKNSQVYFHGWNDEKRFVLLWKPTDSDAGRGERFSDNIRHSLGALGSVVSFVVHSADPVSSADSQMSATPPSEAKRNRANVSTPEKRTTVHRGSPTQFPESVTSDSYKRGKKLYIFNFFFVPWQ
jgi:hypothetical protein